MCEGLSKISGPIPAHPSFLPDYNYKTPRNDNPLCQGKKLIQINILSQL
jgi:hypothetical protein